MVTETPHVIRLADFQPAADAASGVAYITFMFDDVYVPGEGTQSFRPLNAIVSVDQIQQTIDHWRDAGGFFYPPHQGNEAWFIPWPPKVVRIVIDRPPVVFTT